MTNPTTRELIADSLAAIKSLAPNGGGLLITKAEAFLAQPEPPNLKQEALALINHNPADQPFPSRKGIDTIRRALESIPDSSQ